MRRKKMYNNQNQRGQFQNNNQGGKRFNRNFRRRPQKQSNVYEGKTRQQALQGRDKYLSMAQEAQMQGDRIRAEWCFQHAEHYARIVLYFEEQDRQQQEADEANRATDMADGDEGDEGDEFEGEEADDADEDGREAAPQKKPVVTARPSDDEEKTAEMRRQRDESRRERFRKQQEADESLPLPSFITGGGEPVAPAKPVSRPSVTLEEGDVEVAPRRRGRPKGSVNKPKEDDVPEGSLF